VSDRNGAAMLRIIGSTDGYQSPEGLLIRNRTILPLKTACEDRQGDERHCICSFSSHLIAPESPCVMKTGTKLFSGFNLFPGE
jgi:hypothetical protein